MSKRSLLGWLAVVSVCLISTITSAAEETVPVLVRFQNAPGQADFAKVAKHRGVVTRQFRIVPAVAAKLPAAAIANLQREPGVAAVELDALVEAHDLGSVWGVRRIGCEPVQNGTYSGGNETGPVLGTGVRVAVIDTGIDYFHPQLAPNYRGGIDFVNNDADPWDDHYHGTHVAGTVAAVKDGVGVVGVAPQVDLYGVKVLSATGSGSYSSIIAALDWCVTHDMHIAQLSLGSSGDPGSTVKAAFDNAYAAGLVIVASAGNSGSGTDTVGYPAKYASVIAVGATTSSDTRSSFSSTGPDVEIAAPGSSIYSTYPGNSYAYLSGTSMAAPHVSGTAALLLSTGIEDWNGDGRVNDEVRLVLQLTAEDLGAAGRDNEFGYGLVDAELATIMAYNPNGAPPEEPAPVFNAPSNLAGTVSGSQVTLTWLDNSNVEDGFELQYGVKVRNKTTWYAAGTVGADVTSQTLTLSDGSYLLRVRAMRNSGSPATTEWSNQISLTVDTSGGGSGGPGNGKGGGKK